MKLFSDAMVLTEVRESPDWRLFRAGSLFLALFVLWTCMFAWGANEEGQVRIIEPAEAEMKVLAVFVGRSTTIETPWLVKRVMVADPGIADVQVLSPQQVLLVGKSVGLTDLVLWGEEEEVVWRAQVDVQVDLGRLRENLQRLFPESRLEVVQTQDFHVVTGKLDRAERVGQLHEFLAALGINYVDMTSLAGVQQVEIAVKFAEVNRNAMRSLGVDVYYTEGNFFFDSVVGSDLLMTPLLTGYDGHDLDVTLQALAEDQMVRILAEPTLVAMSGEEASFLAGGEFPVPISQGGGVDDEGITTRITVEWKEYGVRLNFRPMVLGDGSIRLYVAPEVSTLTDIGGVQVSGFTIPGLLTRRAGTTLELKNGQTFAIAGLLNEDDKAINSRVPLLGDLPILGALFRSVKYERGETELLVLVTASLVEPSSTLTTGPVPGGDQVPPEDWELYLMGQLEGSAPRNGAGAADREGLTSDEAGARSKERFHGLRGPGGWAGSESLYSPSVISKKSVAGRDQGSYAGATASPDR